MRLCVFKNITVTTHVTLPAIMKNEINTKINKLKIELSNGEFTFNVNDNLNSVLKNNNVPNKPGVYIIFGIIHNKENIIYIGKSGTMTTNGEFRKQLLAKRLKAKQNGMPREKYFKSIIANYGFNNLKFIWFISFEGKNKILPAKLEADLLQSYYNEHKKLPILNKEI